MPVSLPDKPVIEQIVSDILAKLAAVTIEGGYHLNLLPSRPSPRDGVSFVEGAAFVTLGDRTPETDCPQQYEQFLQSINIRCHRIESDQSETTIDELLQIVAADVHVALCGDAATRQRDGWAIDTVPGDVTPLPRNIDANEGTIDVEVMVQYRHNFGNPYISPFRS